MIDTDAPDLREFLAWEEKQEAKYEFADGHVSFFPGGTKRHMTICLNIAHALRLGGLPAETVVFEMKAVTAASSRYPDVAVTLDPRDRPEHTSLRYPVVIFEVLSASTEAIDRGPKFDEYRSIETLRDYVLVDSRKRWVQIARHAGNDWIVGRPLALGAFRIESIGVDLSVDDLYAGTEL